MKHYTRTISGSHVSVVQWKDNPSQIVKSSTGRRQSLSSFSHKWYADRGWKVVGAVNLGFFVMNQPNSLHLGLLARDSGFVEGVPNNGHEMWLNRDGKLNIAQLNTQGIKGIGNQYVWGTSLAYQLVKNKKKSIIGTNGFNTSEVTSRTAFGQTADGELIAACIRNANADKTADIMITLGCVDAIMGDGGGSSQMMVNGKSVFNSERALGTALLIFAKEDAQIIQPNNPFSTLPKYKDIRATIRKHPTLKFPDNGILAKTDIAIHHSLTLTGSAEAYANYHIDRNGWPGIGYSFVIEQDGTIKHCNDINLRTYHVGNSNDFSVGICLTGDFRTQKPTKEQEESLRALHKALKQAMPNYKQTRGHNEFPGYATKQCPVFDYNAVLSEPKPKPDNVFYRVQVGFFGVKANAERLAKELEEKGYQTIIKEETR